MREDLMPVENIVIINAILVFFGLVIVGLAWGSWYTSLGPKSATPRALRWNARAQPSHGAASPQLAPVKIRN
jgi:hypothetical protein